MNKDTKCLIWKTPALEIATDPDGFLRLNSVRVCGKYMIHSDQLESVNELLDDRGKARLTTWLINQRQQGELCPKINRQDIEVAKNAQDMRVLKRLDRVLEFLGTLIKSPISGVTMNPNPIKEDGVPDGRTTVYYQLMAYSESITWEGDLKKLLEHLVKNKLIKKMDLSRDHYHCVLEMSGFEYVEHLRQAHPQSDKVFVAMWFDGELKSAYDKGIKLAIEGAGYKPLRIDEQHFTGKIDDRIISEIRRSLFVVADFSKGKDGARGGVYYEAGFAKGLGLKVIFTCRKTDLNDVHFDTRQYNHIVWENSDDLRKQLEERITAIIGDGPHKQT